MSAVADQWKQKLLTTNNAKTTTSVMGLYDEWSTDYDESLDQWGYEAPKRGAQLLDQHMQTSSSPKLKILDIGSGTGLVADALLQHEKFKNSTIYAMDLSAKSLDLAAKKCVYQDFCEHSFNETPYRYPDNTFDAITCIGTLTYCDHFPKVFKEWIRITKPGAVMVMTHRSDMMPRDQTYFNGMEATLQWKKMYHIKSQPYLPSNENYGDKIRVDYYVAKNTKRSSRL